MSDVRNMTDENVMRVRKEDKAFIRSMMSLSLEKQVLLQGIIIGLNLQKKQDSDTRKDLC